MSMLDGDLSVGGETLTLKCQGCQSQLLLTTEILSVHLANVTCPECRTPLFMLSELCYD